MGLPVVDDGAHLQQASAYFRWAAAVVGFGLLLRESEHRGAATLDSVMQLARGAIGRDAHGDREPMLGLMRTAGALGVGSRGSVSTAAGIEVASRPLYARGSSGASRRVASFCIKSI